MAVLGLGKLAEPRIARAISRGRCSGPVAARRMADRDAAAGASGDGGRNRLGLRLVPIRAVSKAAPARETTRCAGSAATGRDGPRAPRLGGARDGARPDQYARLRPDATAPGRTGARNGDSLRCARTHRHGRRAARGLSGDSRGGSCRGVRTAAGGFPLGRSRRAARDARRQGRVLRFGRTRHQGRAGHAADEEGHGRRGLRAGARPPGHGEFAAGAPAGPGSGGGERDLGRCLPPR